ncbi:hypothetical protein EIP91_010015 [Steccherinum ochraceum]|uniref:Rho GTPase-activating protein 39 n=1 Tax=Steccherinum ochraceum TaxID=92696 RepID=A0A4R0R3M3_9APHY|nr:hypothetical protein EIP91_010015 [Steccherinum ochraceum]
MPVVAQTASPSPSRPKTSDGSSNAPSASSQRQNSANTSSDIPPAPEVHVNGKPAPVHDGPSLPNASGHQPEGGWGANFWVTLVDPQTGVSFFACPASGEVSWDPPVGNFLPDGEWWEMIDESSGLPYYYQTKTGETVWERPQAFVIPLGILQNTALGRRLSLTNRNSKLLPQEDPSGSGSGSNSSNHSPSNGKPAYHRSRSYALEQDNASPRSLQSRRSQSSTRSTPPSSSRQHAHSNQSTPTPSPAKKPHLRKSTSGERHNAHHLNGRESQSPLAYQRGHPLAPIPGSPYATDTSPPPSPRKSNVSGRSRAGSQASKKEKEREKEKGEASPKGKSVEGGETNGFGATNGLNRTRSSKSTHSSYAYRAPAPQSLTAALEMIALSNSQPSPGGISPGGMDRSPVSPGRRSESTSPTSLASPIEFREPPKISIDPSYGGRYSRDAPRTPSSMKKPPVPMRNVSEPSPVVLRGKEISAPTLNTELTQSLSPVKNRALGKPIPIQPQTTPTPSPAQSHPPQGIPGDIYGEGPRRVSLNTGVHPVLPDDLASDILQFSESRFAKQYFSTHRTGFIFKRKVPVSQMMTWQKTPLSGPLLQLMNKQLYKEAVKVFRSIQRIMGDRSGPSGSGMPPPSPHNGSTTSLHSGLNSVLLEEERWLLGQGLMHGELRDEIYCQVMKQLSGNPSAESTFKGWQLLCVILVTFPPSKNFEGSLHSYLQQATSQQEGRVDVMAKYCLRRLDNISRKGPRGKPPTLAEIETASDAAFHPSIFGESLDVTYRLQERNYPHQKVPIILPFLADGILALGGTKSEGIFRVPGDGDAVSELKLRIDKGYYTLDGFDDPTVLASCLKLWLRELCDPLVPEEMYNDCITHAKEPETCVSIVSRLPTINRRVVVFVISFLQLFLEEKVCAVTKMTSANLALVMAPNLLRCNSDSMAVVFTNAQYEQTFVHNLLLHLKCSEIDPDYIPTHGHGAVPPEPSQLRKSKSRRRANY